MSNYSYNSNYNDSNSWDKSGQNQGRPGQGQPLQELLKLQQQLAATTGSVSNNQGRPQPYNPAQPGSTQNPNFTGRHATSNGPIDQQELEYLKQKLVQQQSYYPQSSAQASTSSPSGVNNYQSSRPPGNQPQYTNTSQGQTNRPGSAPYGGNGPPGGYPPPYDPRIGVNPSDRYGGPPPQQPGQYPPSGFNSVANYPGPPRNVPPPGVPYHEPPRNGPPGGYPQRNGPGYGVGQYNEAGRSNYPGSGTGSPAQGYRPPYNSSESDIGSRGYNPKNIPPSIGTMSSPFSKPSASSSGNSGTKTGSRRSERRRDRRDRQERGRDRDRNNNPPPEPRNSRSRDSTREKSPRKHKETQIETRHSSRSRDVTRTSPSFQYSLASTHIDLLQLRQRYTRMKIPKDFAAVERIWTEEPSLAKIPKDFEIPFICASEIDENSTIEKEISETYESASVASDGCYYASKILLYAGQREPKKVSHPSNSYRFIVGRKNRAELFCIGGYWSKELDGGDPACDRSILTKTAARCCKQFCGLDLSECEWMHFLEIQYQRSNAREISAILIPRIWELSEFSVSQKKDSSPAGSDTDDEGMDAPVPDLPELPTSSGEDKKEETIFVIDTKPDDTATAAEAVSDEKKDNRVRLVTKVPEGIKLKALDLSLYGLLEYDESDDTEKTFEVSLAGELFSDILKRDFGATIRKGLEAFRTQRAKLLMSDEPPRKKQKTEDGESEVTANGKKEDGENSSPAKDSAGRELSAAFDFFDRSGRGYFRPEQLENILYSLGEDISVREVEELVDPLIDADSGRILYKKLIADGVLAQTD